MDEREGTFACQFDRELGDGTRVRVEDQWSRSDAQDGFVVDRTIRVDESGGVAGVRTELLVDSALPAAHAEWQFFIPGALYNRNDTNLDGKEDYLGSYVQEYRDDRNGQLAVLAYLPSARLGFSLARTLSPKFDYPLSDDELISGRIVSESDIGSLGLISEAETPLRLRAGYPFGEERTFGLDTTGRGWEGFLPAVSGVQAAVQYELRVFEAPDLTEAIWSVGERQRFRLKTAPTPLPMPLEQLAHHRFALTQQYFRAWSEDEDPRRPAGYLTHFSPRNGQTLGSLLEFGFTGAQSMHALASIRRGHREGVPLWITRGRQVNDFFVRECQSENGFAEGLYDTRSQRFVQWFTGILMPFQYSNDENEVRAYLGSQITDALIPIAAELRDVSGNYTRTMCEAMYSILLAYEEESRHGIVQAEWLAAGERLGDFLLRTQESDGSWYRGYSPSGEPLTRPEEWFGRGHVEQRSGTIFPVPVLAALHRLTGKKEYKDAALRAADFVADTYVADVLYCGGLNDTTQVKSVKIDSTGVLFAMRSLITAFRVGGEQRHLEAAVRAAKVVSSWLFLWDVPFPAESLLEESDFKTTGWAICDAIPAGSYIEDVLLEFVGDLLDVATAAAIPEFVDICELVLNGMQQGLSIPGKMLGYAAPGIQCEGFMTSYWLSAPETALFSGAVGKRKGDDNDTCNGFVNAAALCGLDTVREVYGMLDFASIRAGIAS
ncbi:hypothetical protein [Humibacter albus]|uniref:hypothetical protein n=1 Tax=Humibacter albus TaxID=427754 RepID=UPI0012F927B0|nr:hypothetical protein [Humibacter albus]